MIFPGGRFINEEVLHNCPDKVPLNRPGHGQWRSSLLDDDGQVHIEVDATVEMVGADGVEWSNGHTLTSRVELQVVDGRCIRFYSWFSGVICPGSIANNVYDWNIIDEVEATALADRDRWLSEGCLAHMDTCTRARAATGTAARCCGQNGEQA